MVDLAWTIGREADGKKIVWPKYVVDHLPGAVLSTIAQLRRHGIEGPWIVMATLMGIKDFRIILGEGYTTGPAWQDSAYLGEIVDDAMAEGALQSQIEGFWRLFGVDQPPELRR